MSDSTENTKDIDSYGVWVKRPPQDAAKEELDFDNDLPDFSDLDSFTASDSSSTEEPVVADNFSFDSLDDNEDTALSEEELSNISGDFSLEETDSEGENPDFMSESVSSPDVPEAAESLDIPETTEASEGSEVSDAMSDLDLGDLPDFSEETSDNSFETTPEEPAAEAVTETPAEDTSLDDMFSDIPDFGEINSDDAAIPQEAQASDSGAPAEESLNTEDISTSDFDLSSQEDGEISLDDFMDGGFSDPEGASPAPAASESAGISPDAFSSDEISLDDFLDDALSTTQKEDDISNDDPLDINVDFNKSEEDIIPTQEISEETDSNDEVLEESGAEESSFDEMFNSESEELSLGDFGVDENSDDATAVAAGEAVNSSSSGEEEIDLSDFGIDSNAEETPVEQDVQGAKKNQQVDYDLAITDEDTAVSAPTATEVTAASDSIPAENAEPSSSVSNKLLEQIIADLSGLKSEINSLKGEFETLKSKETITPTASIVEDAAQNPQASVIEDTPTESFETENVPSESTGFFSNDDEDETIALSGSELDNIMNTVDFSEEGTDEGFESEEPAVTEEPVISEEPAATEDAVFTEEPALSEEPVLSDDTALSMDAVTEEPIVSEEITPSMDVTPAADPIETDFSDDTPFNAVEESSFIASSEEPDSGLSMEFSDETLEEPNLDDIDNIDPEAESEIAIPSVNSIATDDDELSNILVESSNEDLMDSVKDTEVPLIEDTIEMDTPEVAEDIVEDVAAEPEVEPELVQDEESFDMVEDMLKEDPSVEEQISDENMTYLSEDPVCEESFADDEVPTVSGIIAQREEENKAEGTIAETPAAEAAPGASEASDESLPSDLKADVKSVLLYMDQLLENLPEEKIVEFAKSEQFATYKKLFNELGLS